MKAFTIHLTEVYLRNKQNPTLLYVKIEGKRRCLFISRNENAIGIVVPGKRKRGYIFANWASIREIYYPSQEQEAGSGHGQENDLRTPETCPARYTRE